MSGISVLDLFSAAAGGCPLGAILRVDAAMAGRCRMTFSQTGAEHRGSRRKAFVERIRKVVTEYSAADLGATAAMAEVKAAIRDLDRQGKGK